jgi:RNA ligase
MISDDDTFGGDNNEFARECRGITFDRQGRIAARPLHKFFNVGEREETQEQNLPWNDVTRVMDKRDGSMITAMIIDGLIVCKSKKSFDSDVAQAANAFIASRQNYIDFVNHCDRNGSTPIFEFTAPNQYRIVLPYAEQNLVLLHVRDNVTGVYLNCEVAQANADFGIPVVDVITTFHHGKTFSFSHMKDAQETFENVEGWVIQFNNGDMVKAKTAWYLALHHVVVFQTERAIAQMVLAEKVDDLKSAMVAIGVDMTKIHAIEHRIVSALTELREKVEAFVHPDRHLERKEFAIKHRSNELFSLMINVYLGKEPNYADFFERNYLKEQFDLVQI